MTDMRLGLYTRVVHPFLAVFVPFQFFTVAGVVLVGGVFGMFAIEVFPPFFPLVLLLVGLAETVSGNLLHKARVSGIAPRIRELLLVLLVSFGLILLLYGDLTSGDVDLSRFNIWFSMVFVLGQWLFSLHIHTKLRERELFLGFFEGKDQRTFPDVYASYSHEAGEAFSALGAVRRVVIGYIVVVFVLLVIATWAVRLEPSGSQVALIVFFFVSSFAITSLLGRYRDMLRVLMTGHVVTAVHARIKNATMLFIFAAVVVLALPLSGRQPWLSTDYLVAFGYWLSDLASRNIEPREVRTPEIMSVSPMDGMEDRMSGLRELMGERDTGTDIARYVGYTLLALLGVGLIAFLFTPLLRLRGTKMNLRQALGHALLSLRRGLVSGWSSVVRVFRLAVRQGREARARLSRERRSAVVAGEYAGAALAARGVKRDRRVHGRILKSFMKYARWAGRHDVVFRTSIAPREFSEMVARKLPDRSVDCLEIAELFEEIVYSHHEIGEDVRDRYHRKVATLVRSR